MEVSTHSPEETQNLAKQLSTNIVPGSVIALYGDLGAGKTTFVNYLVGALGFSSRVQSPTFVIARKYISPNNQDIKIINHLDLYRITSREELRDLDLTEYLLTPNAITLIEWPEYAEELLPANTIRISITITGDTERRFNVQNIS